MNINVTLIGQVIIFLMFVAFTMKFVWPPIQEALEERQKNIADGLNAAEQGKKELEQAEFESKRILQEARSTATSIIESANQRAHQIEEKAQVDAHHKADKIKAQSKNIGHDYFLAMVLLNVAGSDIKNSIRVEELESLEEEIESINSQIEDVLK